MPPNEPRIAKQTPDTPEPPAAEAPASRYHVTNHVDSTGHQTRNFSLFEDGALLAVFATKRDPSKSRHGWSITSRPSPR